MRNSTETVVRGKDVDFALFVELPKEADRGGTIFSATILYDTGFKSTDTLRFVRVYSTQVSKWVKTWNGISVDFTTEK